MSQITTVAIVAPDKDDEAIAFVNEAMQEQARGQKLEPLGNPHDEFGGFKVPSCAIYGAGYNYADWGTLEDALNAAPWHAPESVIAWIYHQETGDVTLWRPAGR